MVASIQNKSRQRLWRWLTVFVVALPAINAQAVTLSPVVLELTPTRRVAAVTVGNDSDKPMALQAQVLAWTQVDGKDRLEASDDLLAAPQFAEIKPGGAQIFRVALRRPTAAIGERAYRLALEDASEIKEKTKGAGVVFRYSHRLPVFVAGSGKIGPKPQLGRCAVDGSSYCVRIDNQGDRFVQITRLTVDGGAVSREIGGGARVLAGAWRQWTFTPPQKQSGPLTVHAETSVGPLELKLPAVGTRQ